MSEPSIKAKAWKPTHYKVLCISLYTADVDRLARVVSMLKARGAGRAASNSGALRLALEELEQQLGQNAVDVGLDRIARIVAIARQVGEHWRTQEGINATLLDELAEATRP